MQHRLLDPGWQEALTALFSAVFSASEGEEEGRVIGRLVAELSSDINGDEIIAMGTVSPEESLIAAIFFSRLRFAAPDSQSPGQSTVSAYLLSPVAVSTAHQRQGIGQALINFGLDQLRRRGASLAVTYGDPAYYGKLGFEPLAEDLIQAPMPLSMPHGWLGQTLDGTMIPRLAGRPGCVSPFNDPALW